MTSTDSLVPTSRTPIRSFRGRSIVLGSAWYDLIVTAALATPWTAKFFLSSLTSLQSGLGIGGDPLPTFEPEHLFFAGLLGTTVTMWSVIRLMRPSAFLGRADGLIAWGSRPGWFGPW